MTREEFLERIDEIMCGTSNAERAYLEDLYNEVTKPHWISVFDETPKVDMLIFVVQLGKVTTFRYQYERAEVLKNVFGITHWMPLPQAPKKGGKE